MTYALGRGVDYYDEPAVRGIVAHRVARRLSASCRSFAASFRAFRSR